MSHPMFTLLLATLISAALAMTDNRANRERVYHAIRVFSAFIFTAAAGSWAMYLIHG
jgi:hypothetical protein